jgi:simple sugar transport system permease protein
VVNIAIEGMMLGACFFGFIGAGWFKSMGVPDQAALWLGVVRHADRFLVCRAARRAVHPLQGESDHQRHGDQHPGRGLDGLPEPPTVLSTGETSRNRQHSEPLYPFRCPICSLIGGIFNQPPITYLALILVIVTQFVLFRTVWGLRTRSVGEHPRAADTVGINVYKMRYANVLLGGMIAGLAGAFFTLQSVGAFEPGMTAGRGFIALAAMIFGNWSPVGAFAASLLFASAQAFQINLQFYWPPSAGTDS